MKQYQLVFERNDHKIFKSSWEDVPPAGLALIIVKIRTWWASEDYVINFEDEDGDIVLIHTQYLCGCEIQYRDENAEVPQ